jgi:hypothetical protein
MELVRLLEMLSSLPERICGSPCSDPQNAHMWVAFSAFKAADASQ